MVLCNFCNRKETRNRPFANGFTCLDCLNNTDNYLDTYDETTTCDDIIFISSEGKKIITDESMELNLIHEKDDAKKYISPHNSPINSNDFKDSLLASLYTQLEFLKQIIVEKDHQLEECNLHIRALLTRESDVIESEVSNHSIECKNDVTSSTRYSDTIADEPSHYICNSTENQNDEDENTDKEIFTNLYEEFVDFEITEMKRKKEIQDKIATQLVDIREMKHAEYMITKNNDDDKTQHVINRGLKPIHEEIVTHTSPVNMEHLNADETKQDIEVHSWPNGTCLVMGSSLLNGVKEDLMGPRFKVRAFPGAIIDDFYHYAIPLVKKKPSSIILMAGSNDAVNKNKSSQSILEELLKLKSFLQSKFRCDVILSCPTHRFDDQKANPTFRNLRNNLSSMNIPVISNANITDMHIGKKGLHLNERGSGRLAMNYLSYMRKH